MTRPTRRERLNRPKRHRRLLGVEPLEHRCLLAAGPDISAVMFDALAIDGDGDGKADPGDTIYYEATITNRGDRDAKDVGFLAHPRLSWVPVPTVPSPDTIFPPGAFTDLVPDSVNVSPLPFDDLYRAVGNTRLDSRELGLPTLFANDKEFLNDTFSLDTFDTVSQQGGKVWVRSDGSFTYLPPAGFKGVDTFTYTVVDSAGLTGAAKVSMTIDALVWYVDQDAPSNGDGRSTSPFRSLAPLNGIDGDHDRDGPTDYIYLDAAEKPYDGGFVLEDGQQLIGSGADLTVGSYTIRRAGQPPMLTNSAGDGIVLADANHVAGIDIVDTLGNGLSGRDITDAVLGHMNIVDPGNHGIDLSDVHGTLRFDETMIRGIDGIGMSIRDLNGVAVFHDLDVGMSGGVGVFASQATDRAILAFTDANVRTLSGDQPAVIVRSQGTAYFMANP